MPNVFDQFDDPKTVNEQPPVQGNVFDKFDSAGGSSTTSPEQNQEWFSKRFGSALDDIGLEKEKQGALRNQESLFKAIKNTPSSAYQFAANIYDALRHPVDTANALYKTAKGGVEKVIPNLPEITGTKPDAEHFDKMVEFFKERYGGEDQLRNTIETDPVGFLADVSSVLSGAGATVMGGASIAKTVMPSTAKVAESASTIGRGISELGALSDPLSMAIQGPANLIGKTIPKTGKLSPEALYESAIKPSTTLSKEERMTRVTTALENNILPTQKGLDKIRSLISGIDDEVSNIIKTGPYKGNPINTDAVVKYLDELKDFAKKTVNPQDALEDIAKVEQKFLEAKGTAMSVEDAHILKKNTYTELNKFYDKFTRNATIEAKKALARGLKEEVYALYPELRSMGKKEGALIALEESIERASSRISNRDIIGLGIPMKGAAGGIVGGAPGAIATTAIGILDTPIVKSALAQALYKARQGVGPIKGTKTRSALFQLGRLEDEY